MSQEKIIEILNQDRADELGAIIQYMGHHYEAEGLESKPVADEFKDVALDEMKHAERLAERIVYLGGIPTQKPAAIKRGGSLREMIQDDLAAENEAIKRYREQIKLAAELGDPTTRLMLEEILSDEEEHADIWETLLGRPKN